MKDGLTILKEMGVSWFTWRSLYELGLRTGMLARFFPSVDPVKKLAESLNLNEDAAKDFLLTSWQLDDTPHLLSSLAHYAMHIHEPEVVLEVANKATQGDFRLFSHQYAFYGSPPDWLLDPISGQRYPNDKHWTRIPDLDRSSDIKFVWEAARSSHVFAFVRAYALTSDEKYPEAFWRQLESWFESNSTEIGPHWRCGQEIAIRTLAWVFALDAFRDSKASSPKRVGNLLACIWYQALHIERIHWYASKCVRNNHSITEAAALFTVGALFPFLPRASVWRKKGFAFLCQEGMWQIYGDGTYVQHSMNYSRLVVQTYSWSLAIAKAIGVSFPPQLLERLSNLCYFLWSCQDEATGRLPNYGSNDGTLLLPLSSCSYLDFRPSLNALHVQLAGEALYPNGAWSEEAVWLVGPQAAKVRVNSGVRKSSAFQIGGYYVLRDDSSFGFIRCGKYLHRPNQADMLHFDLWYGGENVLLDPGTWSYNAPDEWREYFTGTGSHNTISIDGKSQMRKGKRFLWHDWVHGKEVEGKLVPEEDGWASFVGEHDGYSPGSHRRSVQFKNGVWIIIDDIRCQAEDSVIGLHWLLPKKVQITEKTAVDIIMSAGSTLRFQVACSHEGIVSWLEGDDQGPRGWQSLYYGEKHPVWSFRYDVRSGEPVRFVTLIGPKDSICDLSIYSRAAFLANPRMAIEEEIYEKNG